MNRIGTRRVGGLGWYGRLAAGSSIAAVLALVSAYAPAPVAAASACSTTTGPGGYSVQTCLAAPSGAAHGTVTVSVTVVSSATSARPSTVRFCLDGTTSSKPSCLDGGAGYLARDFNFASQPSQLTTVWSIALPTAHWIDGAHTLLASATMRDGTVTRAVTLPLSFANGNSTQPINNSAPSIHTGTTPAAGAPLVVAAVGDGAAGDAAARSVVSRIKSWSPNLFLYLGDVYLDGSYAEFTNWYNPTFGSLRSITNPVIGNHEYISRSDPATSSRVSPAGVAYFDYWNNLPHYYSFDAGGWHFIALDANRGSMSEAIWAAQTSWLKADLASHSSKCTIAYWHHPAFNIGQETVPASATALWSLVAGKATLVLNGHDHTYQRWAPMNTAGSTSSTGTVEIVAGTGGHALGPFESSDARVLAKSTRAGAVKLSLTSNSAGVQFIASSGSVLDSATIPCR